MSDVTAISAESDVVRLSALFNQILGEEKDPNVFAGTAAM